jgi:hypothetical protein
VGAAREAALLGCGAAQGEEGVAAEQRLGRGVDACAERAECWAGRAGKELGRSGRGRRAGPREGNGPAGERGGLRVGLRSWVWAGLTLGVGLLSISLLLNLIQTKFEFKYEFEFKPQSNKSMHQHECNTKFKPMINFNYLKNKIELNALLNTINLRNLNKAN